VEFSLNARHWDTSGYIDCAALGNKSGIASAHNNIAAAQLELKNYPEAELHFSEAIRLGEEVIAEIEASGKQGDFPALAKLKRTVSDRRGNLVVLRLHQDDFAGAFLLLEQCLSADKNSGYIMGCIVKQVNVIGLCRMQNTAS
jgi:hypothetical protein